MSPQTVKVSNSSPWLVRGSGARPMARTAGMVNTETINHFPDIKCTFKLWKWSDKKHFASSKIIMKLVWTCYRERRGYLGSEIASQNTNSLHFSAVQTEDRLRVRCPAGAWWWCVAIIGNYVSGVMVCALRSIMITTITNTQPQIVSTCRGKNNLNYILGPAYSLRKGDL